MRRYFIFFGVCVFIALVLVFAFAPWAFALSVSDPSTLKATLAIMVPVCCVILFGFVAWWAFSSPQLVHFDLSDTLNPDDVQDALTSLWDSKFVGKLAREASEQLSRLLGQSRSCRKVLAATFGTDSMTFDHYWGGVTATVEAGTRTCASIAMRLSSFDGEEYDRAMSHGRETTALALRTQLDDVRRDLDANESLIDELVTLSVEVSKLEAGDADVRAGEILSELHEMVEQVDMYR